jgi:hypothetical protein
VEAGSRSVAARGATDSAAPGMGVQLRRLGQLRTASATVCQWAAGVRQRLRIGVSRQLKFAALRSAVEKCSKWCNSREDDVNWLVVYA